MERNKLLQRLYLLKKNPELYRDLSNAELADFVRVVLLQVEAVAEEIKSGIHDGRTPKEGTDYIGRKEMLAIFTKAFDQARSELDTELTKELTKKHGTVEKAVQKRLDELKDGKDGVSPLITEDMLWDMAFRAYQFLELPNFEALITENPTAIRDSLELLQGDERLKMSAIDGLEEHLRSSEHRLDNKIGATVARRLGHIRDVNAEGATTGQVLTRQSDGTYAFETPAGGPGGGVAVETPVGAIDGVNTVYTVANEPKWIVVNTATYFDGAGYTYAPGAITLAFAPVEGSWLRSIY